METLQKDISSSLLEEVKDTAGLFQQFVDHIDPWLVLDKVLSLVIIALVTAVALKIARHIINTVFNEKKFEGDCAQMRRTLTLQKTTKTFARSMILLTAVLTALSLFIDIGAVMAVAGVGTLAIGLGAKGLVEDLMAGFVIILENYFDVGDYVTIESQYGMIESIGIRTTTVRKVSGELFIIPNGQIAQVLNHSKGAVSGTVRVTVPYEDNLGEIFKTLDALMPRLYEERPELFTELPEVFGVTDTKPSGLEISLFPKCPAELKVRCEAFLRKRILETFVEKGFAFPHEVVTLRECAKNTDQEVESDGK